MSFCVIPAKAGIQSFQRILDPGFRRGDEICWFCNWFIPLYRRMDGATLVFYQMKPVFPLTTSLFHGAAKMQDGLGMQLANPGFGKIKDHADFLHGHLIIIVEGNNEFFL